MLNKKNLNATSVVEMNITNFVIFVNEIMQNYKKELDFDSASTKETKKVPTTVDVIKTYVVNLNAAEIGRLTVGQPVSIVKGGLFSKKYYLLGNPKAGYFSDTISSCVVASK